MDAVFLARIQFALTSMFHYLYPPLSIGLGVMIVIIEGIWVKTRNPLYKEMAQFWVKVFALTFALGVATGLVQLFGFGTNWSTYSKFVGDVFGSALAAEGIFAFFLESGFLGLMLFGWNRIGVKTHYLASILVCLGAHFSAVWIVIANSWMQTPAGFKIENGRAVITDFWAMVFNPSAMDRLVHVTLGCWLSGIFLVLSVSAYYLLKQKYLAFARSSMKMGLIVGAVVLILQLISADSTGRGVTVNQPPKLAAMEGIFETKSHAPITLFGWVDLENRTVQGVQIPGLLSFLSYRDLSAPVQGLNAIPREDWPNVQLVFQTYHLMILMWGLMFFAVVCGLILWKKKKLEKARWLLYMLVFSVLFPQIANQAGWVTAEAGRQPWVVWGLLRTKEAASPNVSAGQVSASILMFLVIYLLLFALFLYLLDKKIKHGPGETVTDTARIYDDPFKSLGGTL